MRPKDIAINIIYKIIQPNVKLFCVMTRHFARPVSPLPLQNIVYSLSSVQRTLCHCDTIYSLSSVQRTLCHCEALTNQGSPRDTLYPWGKGAHKQKSERYRPDNAISKVQCAPHRPEGHRIIKPTQDTCTCVEKKAHTSKRVSIIVYNNVISKAQCAPRRHKLPYGTFAAQRH